MSKAPSPPPLSPCPLLAQHPGSDAQRLRALLRQARKDAATSPSSPPQRRAWRELFRLLRDELENAPQA